MATAGTNAFSGMRPKTASHLLGDENATYCRDVELIDGYLRPLRGGTFHKAFPTSYNTIYKWEDEDKWLTFTGRAHVARSINPAIDRVYYTSSAASAPKVGNVGDAPGMVFEGSGPYPNTVFNLGVIKPLNPPLIRVVVAEPDAERDYTVLDLETRYYVFTQVNEWGEESAASPVSGRIDCYDDAHIEVTLAATPGAGYVPLASVRIYRTNTGTQTTDFQFVTELSLAQALVPFVDSTASSGLAEVAETLLWEPPPVDLAYLTSVGNEFFVGASGREVCFSEVRVPYAWPLAYRFPMEDPIVGLASNGVDTVVLTRGRPVVFSGNSPLSMQMVRIADYQPCVSEHSIVTMDGQVIYASPDGLIGVSSSMGFSNLTEGMFTREQWAALDPASMRITVWERVLLISSDAGGFIFDLARQAYTPATAAFRAAYYDGYTDTLFLLDKDTGTQIQSFATSASFFTYEWRSKKYLLPDRGYASGRVNALSYNDVWFSLEIDDFVVMRRRVHNARPFRLPAHRGRRAHITLEGTDIVRSVSVATSQGELYL